MKDPSKIPFRQRKSDDQLEYLLKMFEFNDEWDKTYIKKICEKTDLEFN